MTLLQSDGKKLKTGDSAPDFSLIGTDGRMHTCADYLDARALLVVFMCNHCPYVLAKIGRLNDIHAKYSRMGLKIVGINPNDAAQYPDDSLENMKKLVAEKGIGFDYLYDETQVVARAYGAVCTPDPFLFDGSAQLVYHGRLDDALSPEVKPTKFIMEDALDAIMRGSLPRQSFLYSQGCSIKWKV